MIYPLQQMAADEVFDNFVRAHRMSAPSCA
jgi:hypothetical protein